MKGKTTASSLNVREGSSTAYPVVKTLARGTVINILDNKKVGTTTWYKIDNNQWVSGKYVDILSDNKNEITVTPNMSMSKIQECLKESGCTIKFNGRFNLTKMLYIYSNTKIDLTDATLIRKHGKYVFFTYANSNTTKYNGQHDIVINGGKIIGDGNKKISNIISLAHGKNIKIQGLTISNNVGSHAIEINGCDNVIIDKCIFDGNIIDKKNPYREAIQIDVSYFGALNYASSKNSKCYDLTHCNNIIIKNCTFKGYTTTVGTHTQAKIKNTKHKNIKILNNTCYGLGKAIKGYGSCFKIMNMEDVLIENNHISKFARGIEICSSNRFYSSNGSITKTKPSYIDGSKHIKILNNYIYDPSKDYQASGVFIGSKFVNLIHEDILIENNTFRLNNGVSKYEIYYGDSATNVVSKNNKSDV